MNVSENIIRDLLPSYLSGEASADSVTLIEQYLGSHPELSNEVEVLRAEVGGSGFGGSTGAVARTTVAIGPEPGLVALRRVKRLLRLRSTLFGIALFLTLLPASMFGGDGTGFHWVFWPGHASIAVTVWGFALGAWIGWWSVDRRLSGTGF